MARVVIAVESRGRLLMLVVIVVGCFDCSCRRASNILDCHSCCYCLAAGIIVVMSNCGQVVSVHPLVGGGGGVANQAVLRSQAEIRRGQPDIWRTIFAGSTPSSTSVG